MNRDKKVVIPIACFDSSLSQASNSSSGTSDIICLILIFPVNKFLLRLIKDEATFSCYDFICQKYLFEGMVWIFSSIEFKTISPEIRLKVAFTCQAIKPGFHFLTNWNTSLFSVIFCFSSAVDKNFTCFFCFFFLSCPFFHLTSDLPWSDNLPTLIWFPLLALNAIQNCLQFIIHWPLVDVVIIIITL